MQQFRNHNSRQPYQQHNNQQPHSHSMRVLNTQDSDALLSSFPTTRLSYEVSIHKNDTQTSPATGIGYKCFILPKGRRCIAWATEWKHNRIFAVIEIDGVNNRQDRGQDRERGNNDRPIIRKFHQENGWYPGRVRIFDACFDRTLVYGTVFGGVMFRTSMTNAQLFSIHTIYWYKGNQIPALNCVDHIQLCEELFYQNNIRQVAYTKDSSVIFGLPVLCNTEQDAERISRELPYDTFAIQYRYFTHTRVFQKMLQDMNMSTIQPMITKVSNTPEQQPSKLAAPVIPTIQTKQIFVPPQDEMLTNIQATFIVRPNIQNDVYELFVLPDNHRQSEPVFHNFALIPSFKTSVMMNRLYRNITENERLDTMEESEDEDDFENTEPDKYVTLSKEYKMVCRFNKRFCKWVPVEVAPTGNVITAQQVKQHELRYVNYRRNK